MFTSGLKFCELEINERLIKLDCEQSLSFPSVFRAIERTSREQTSGEWWAANREKRGRSLLVSFPNLHNINKVPHAEDFRNKNRLLVVYYKRNKPLSGLLVCRLIMSLAERLSSKSHICPGSFASRPNVHFSDNPSAADIISRHTSRLKGFI